MADKIIRKDQTEATLNNQIVQNQNWPNDKASDLRGGS